MNVKGIVMDGGDGGGGGGSAGGIHWVAAKDEDNNRDSIISIGSIVSEEDSMNSSCSSYSSSSSELAEDASSTSSSSYLSTSASSSPHSNGPLYELSDLMNHLPIKRGLSMFYEGKAQSFSSLGRVQSIEDLPKNKMTRASSYRKKIKMKSCKSYGGGLDNTNSHRVSSYYSPKATISKKGGWSSKGSSKRSPSFLARPSISAHKN